MNPPLQTRGPAPSPNPGPAPHRGRGPGAWLVWAAVWAALCAAASGCALKPPAPWERGNLARPEMALQPDPLEARLQQHLYSSKENATGGSSIGGGGCGCN
jgi:hypothetical protein